MSDPLTKRKRSKRNPPPPPAAAKRPRTTKLPSRKDKPDSELRSFVEKHDAILQGTEEWVAKMLITIGGSQIAAVIGMNKYMTRKQLVEKIKAGNPFVPSVACGWGKLFESAIRAYFARDRKTLIHGHDTCILDDNLRYSPDGICSLPSDDGGHDVVLLEFKCPYTRQPDGTIPKHYKPQLWLGLGMMAEIEPAYALFVDAVFRRCRQDQLGDTPDYDRRYHARGKGTYDKPMAWGVLSVYSKKPGETGTINDYGAVDRKVFDGMLMDISKGKMAASLLYLHVRGKEKDVLRPQGHVEGMYHVGVIPFKLMEVYTCKENPFEGFLERAREVAKKVFEDVNKK
jgi:hypothetical protein